ncbi:MAG TPA: hypothetical protein VFZ66_28355 [Herpetosiphonaceae bacterium]
MKTSPFRVCCQLVLLALVMSASLAPGSMRAQNQSPVSSESTSATQDRRDPPRTNARALLGDQGVAATQAQPSAAEAWAEATAAEEEEAETTTATHSTATAGGDPGAAEALPLGVQGVVGLDVSAPDTIRAGDYITYTYGYTNTGGAAVTGVEIDLVWSNATVNKSTATGVYQHCPAAPDPVIANCGLLTDRVVGPTVEVIRAPAASGSSVTMRVRLATLNAGQNGSFMMRLRSNAAKYPKTGEAITRPASSAKLYLSSTQSTPTSEDTANTMIIGPVFVLTKTPLTTEKIYPVVDTAEFLIRIGNATGPGDIVNGQRRVDAITATNVVLKDTVPSGGEFVSASPSGSVTGTTITWNIPSLAPGEFREYRVTFRKLDNNTNCSRLNNTIYNVTSDEMPFNGANRYLESGDAAGVDVVTPLVIKSVVAEPTSVVYGNEATITITVQNYWNQNLNNVVLHYDVQGNAFYIPGTANPAPTVAPNGTTMGGRITWTFAINAGTKAVPVEKTFSLRVRGGYTKAGTGTAQIVAPAGVPAACIKSKNGDVDLKPRLAVKKYTDADPSTMIGDVYIVQRGQLFSYLIDITNSGVADAPSVNVTDLLPNQSGANFAYVVGSSTLNGTRRDPDSFTNGAGGTIVWNNLYVAAGATIRLRYTLQVNGWYYVDYCNRVTATSGNEEISYPSKEVCVKINPQVEITKTVNKTAAGPGEEVQFTLTLTNRESTTFRLGLYDYLDDFTYVRQVTGYAQPQLVTPTDLAWPLVNLGAGQQLQAVIIARMPDPCATTAYDNEALFLAEVSPGVDAVIQPIPRVKARVSCTRLEYSKTVDRTTISLGDRHMYTLTIRNANPAAAITNVIVDDMLPQGFSFVAMDATSVIKTNPAQSPRSDGRTKLSWVIPTIGINATVLVKFIALSGNIVGNHENWLVAYVDGSPGTCKAGCWTESDTGITYSTKAVSVQPMITIAPEIVQTACARPGDIRNYRLTVVNTNSHAYTNTNITATLPFGLNYIKTVGALTQPRVITDSSGVTTLSWVNQTIPAKPANAFAAQVIFEVEVEVGQVWGELITIEQATSPDGLIPRKDGVQNAAVLVCPAQPAIAKEANRSIVRLGDEVRYIISLANTNTTPINATVTDELPANLTYLGMVSGSAPTISGQTLTWNVSVPAASGGKAGTTILVFKTRVDSGEAGLISTNTATVTSSAGAFDTTNNSVSIVVARSIIYVPILQY